MYYVIMLFCISFFLILKTFETASQNIYKDVYLNFQSTYIKGYEIINKKVIPSLSENIETFFSLFFYRYMSI